MRIVFMGTPDFSAAILEQLCRHHEVVGVYTRADAVRSRGMKRMPAPVKLVALQNDLPVRSPQSLKSPQIHAELSALKPDVVCVAAYGMILPRPILEIPRLCCLNVHASLLPRWRGAAPIERAILAGDDETGISIMRMEEGLDTGDYCIQRGIPIGDADLSELTSALSDLGTRCLLTALEHVDAGSAYWTSQDESLACYADKIAQGELDLDPLLPAEVNLRRVRASGQAHPACCRIAGRRVRIMRVCLAEWRQGAAAGDPEYGMPQTASSQPSVSSVAVPCASSVASDMAGKTGFAAGDALFSRSRLYLGCKQGALEVLSLKPDGKKEMGAQAFACGMPPLRNGCRWGKCDG